MTSLPTVTHSDSSGSNQTQPAPDPILRKALLEAYSDSHFPTVGELEKLKAEFIEKQRDMFRRAAA